MIKTILDTEIVSWFETNVIYINIDSHGYCSIEQAKEYLQEQKSCRYFTLDIKLRGFKKAGTKAFDCWKEVTIELHEYKYKIGSNPYLSDLLPEQLYHQHPSRKELNLIVEKVCELLLDDITREIERIR